MFVNLREEVSKRKNKNNNYELIKNNDVINEDSIVNDVTEEIINNYSDIINKVSKGEKSKQVIHNIIEQIIYKIDKNYLKEEQLQEIVQRVTNNILGYGVIQKFVDDEEITDIFINNPESIFYRKNNIDIQVPEIKFKDNEDLERFIRSILIKCGQKIHKGEPLSDARDVEKHLRINAGIPPVAKYPYLALRKHTVVNYTKEDFLKNETFTEEVIEFIEKAVLARLNIVIAGPTGSGKTTLLRFLANSFIPKNQRIVVIEEEEELKISHPNMVALESKKVIGEDEKPIEMDRLVKNSLRMAMRRIILGELRGKEAFTLLRAFGTGHDGGLTTVHSNDVYNTIEQLAIMMLYANTPLSYEHLKMVISQSIDLIIYMEDYKIQEIASVDRFNEETNKIPLNSIFIKKLEGGYERKEIDEKILRIFRRRGISI